MGPTISYCPATSSPRLSFGSGLLLDATFSSLITASSGFVGGMNGSCTMPSATVRPCRTRVRRSRKVSIARRCDSADGSATVAGPVSSSSSAKGSKGTADVAGSDSSSSSSAKGSKGTAAVAGCDSSSSAKGSNATASVTGPDSGTAPVAAPAPLADVPLAEVLAEVPLADVLPDAPLADVPPDEPPVTGVRTESGPRGPPERKSASSRRLASVIAPPPWSRRNRPRVRGFPRRSGRRAACRRAGRSPATGCTAAARCRRRAGARASN